MTVDVSTVMEGGPMMHALSGAATYDKAAHPRPKIVFKPKVDPHKYHHSAEIIQKVARMKAKEHRYDEVMHKLEDSKLLYQRVPEAAGEHLSSEQLHARTLQRSAAAYAGGVAKQLDVLEDAVKLLQDREDAREVHAYQLAKAQRSFTFRPKSARSVLHCYAKTIQSAVRSWLRRRKYAFTFSTLVDTLIESKQFVVPAHEPAGPPPCMRSGSSMGGSLRNVASSARNLLGGVRVDPDERAEVVAEALQRAADMKDEEEVASYERRRREMALRARPKHPQSLLASKATMIQRAIRHRNARAAYATLLRRWSSSETVFIQQRGTRSPSPNVRAGDGEAATATVEADAWMDEHMETLEGAFTEALAVLAEHRPLEPLQFLAAWLEAQSVTGVPSPLPALGGVEAGSSPMDEDAFMLAHAESLEEVLTDAVRAAAESRPERDPLRFVAAHIRGRRATGTL